MCSELFSGDGLQIVLVEKLRLFPVCHVCFVAPYDLGQMFLSLFFGLSTNYYVALVIRTLWGFTNGNLGVLKTYVSETCSEDMQSLGFSVIVTMGGIAKCVCSTLLITSVVGPSLGGFLGDAESYFPSLIQKSPWIRDRPLFLPCVIGSILSVFILIMVLAFLPESLTKAMRIANAEEQKKTQKRYHEIRQTMRKNPDYVPSVDDRYILQLNQGDYISLICNRDVLVSCIIYGMPPLLCPHLQAFTAASKAARTRSTRSG